MAKKSHLTIKVGILACSAAVGIFLFVQFSGRFATARDVPAIVILRPDKPVIEGEHCTIRHSVRLPRPNMIVTNVYSNCGCVGIFLGERNLVADPGVAVADGSILDLVVDTSGKHFGENYFQSILSFVDGNSNRFEITLQAEVIVLAGVICEPRQVVLRKSGMSEIVTIWSDIMMRLPEPPTIEIPTGFRETIYCSFETSGSVKKENGFVELGSLVINSHAVSEPAFFQLSVSFPGSNFRTIEIPVRLIGDERAFLQSAKTVFLDQGQEAVVKFIPTRPNVRPDSEQIPPSMVMSQVPQGVSATIVLDPDGCYSVRIEKQDVVSEALIIELTDFENTFYGIEVCPID